MTDSTRSRTSARPTLAGAVALLALAVTLGGCVSTSRYLSDIQSPVGEALPAPSAADIHSEAVAGSYTVGPLDRLDVRVVGFPDFSSEVQVDSAGHIQLPLVGDFKAAGLTPAELNAQLTTAYERTYLKRPQVSVVVREVRSRYVSIEGEVKRAGLFPIPGNLTLSRAMALAEGPGEFATLNRVAVFRRVDGQQMAAIFDLEDIRLGKYEDPKIYPNDVIVVGSSSVRRAFRDIIQTAPFIAVFRPFG